MESIGIVPIFVRPNEYGHLIHYVIVFCPIEAKKKPTIPLIRKQYKGSFSVLSALVEARDNCGLSYEKEELVSLSGFGLTTSNQIWANTKYLTDNNLPRLKITWEGIFSKEEAEYWAVGLVRTNQPDDLSIEWIYSQRGYFPTGEQNEVSIDTEIAIQAYRTWKNRALLRPKRITNQPTSNVPTDSSISAAPTLFKVRQRVMAIKPALSKENNLRARWVGTVVSTDDSDGYPLILWDEDRSKPYKTNPSNLRLEEAWLVGNIIVKKGDFIKAKKDSADGKYKAGETGWISGMKNGYPLVVWMRKSEENPSDLEVI